MKNLLTLLIIILTLGAGQAHGQFVWTKDVHNPVLTGEVSGAWNKHVCTPCVLFNADSARYEMWFGASEGATSDFRPFRVGFAVSKDGVNWTMNASAVLSPDLGAWDAYTVELPMVIRESGQYKMWYTARAGSDVPRSLGYATSSDGIHWTKYPGNPVMGPGKATWEAVGPYGATVMPVAGGYKMWYAGGNGTSGSDSSNIGYAISADGISWQRDTVNNPVLKTGATGQWDDSYLTAPQVLRIGNTYYMWYSGGRRVVAKNTFGVGVATSKDSGKTWTKCATNPVLPLSDAQWDGTYIMGGTVLLRGDTLDMWYHGSWSSAPTFLWRIGHATSPVLVPTQWQFKKYAGNPILTKGSTGFDATYAQCPVVLYVNGTYRMWYWGINGSVNSIGYATSPNGINWTKYSGNPVLTADPNSFAWDGKQIRIFKVHYDGERFHMLYAGYSSSDVRRIGYAYSTDGIYWTKNPTFVLDVGASGTWEGLGVIPGDFMKEGSNWRLWYDGLSSTGTWRAGYATANDSVNWTRHPSMAPIMDNGAAGEWDADGQAIDCVRKVGTNYHMWYHNSAQTMIGYAVSYDGISWNKSPANPMLSATPGTWDQSGTLTGWMIRSGKKHFLYYTGGNPTDISIGLAIDSNTVFPDSTGENTDTGIRTDFEMPQTFMLSQNYPNPFNPTTLISYQLPVNSDVMLKVYDLLGREVATLVNERKGAGRYSMQWDASQFSSGIYFYRLQAGQFTETKKMILMK